MMAGWSWKKWAGMLGALAAMCVSAYGVGRRMSLMAMISGWTGLAQHDSAIPGLKWQVEIWSGIAVVFPFVAAALLGIGNDGIASAGSVRTGAVSYPEESREGNAATGVVLYLLRLGISVAGVVLIVGGFVLVVILLQKLGVHGQ